MKLKRIYCLFLSISFCLDYFPSSYMFMEKAAVGQREGRVEVDFLYATVFVTSLATTRPRGHPVLHVL